MAVEYQLYFYTPEHSLDVVISEYVSISYTLIVNEIHAATIVMPGIYDGDLDEDTRIEIYRDGELVGDTQFFVIEFSIKLGADGSYTTEIQAAGALVVLSWPIVDYAPGRIESRQSDYAGNIIKALARQNIGSLAEDAGRDMSARLSIQADADDGAVVTVNVGWRRLLDVVREVGSLSAEAGTRIYYDIIKSGGGLQLQTFSGQRGTDRSASVLLSPERETLANATLTKSYATAASRVIVGGAGQEIWRNVVRVANTDQANNSPWGYIKEHFYQAAHANTTAEATAVGNAYLGINVNKITLSGSPVMAGGIAYGTDYGWGDKISIEFQGFVAVVSLDRVTVDVSDGVENVLINARGEVA